MLSSDPGTGEADCSDVLGKAGDPTEECLRLAVPHILHDLELLELAWKDQHLRIGWTLWFITAREMMDFFFCYERKSRNGEFTDDILAGDYLDAGVWKRIAEDLKTEKPADYGDIRHAANKLSAHLTYSRVDKKASGGTPPSEAVHEFLLGTAAVWLNQLEPRRRVWFGSGWSRR